MSLVSYPVSSYQRSTEDGIKLSSFQLSVVAETYEVTTWHLDEGILDNILVKKLFLDNFTRYASFLDAQTEVLNSLRAFFFAYRGRARSKIQTIDECTVF
mmetsp:Transcript_8318/g.11418  ORF Transcript_8318/g.11418 Transcript_8318/m.11418 type:complete len:100 (+) Transcript_8318:395-694(+)